jgi:hypothetical protein
MMTLTLDLSAKYWLRNTLSHENFIVDGFYDIGSAGPNLDAIENFPNLGELQHISPNKKRETLLIDWTNDILLQQIYFEATEGLSSKTPQGQIRQIARIISKYMGGNARDGKIEEFSYKFRISELKLKLNSNIIPLGQVSQGIFYHRALLFKAICDRIGLSPCTLVRGEYNRAWNIVEPRKQSLTLKTYVLPKETSKEIARKPPSKPSDVGMDNVPEEDDEGPIPDTSIVDLMYEPGKLLALGTHAANEYQRMY